MRMGGSGSGSDAPGTSSGADGGARQCRCRRGARATRHNGVTESASLNTDAARAASSHPSISLSALSLPPSLFSRSLSLSLSLSLPRPSVVPVSGSVLAAIASRARAGGKRLSVNKT